MSPSPQRAKDNASAPTSSRRRASESNIPARSRPRASVACVNCRQKKTKCNVQSLGWGKSCSACRSSNVDCVVIRNGDRRKHGSREHMTALQGRMDSLEALINRYGVNIEEITVQQTDRASVTSSLDMCSESALPPNLSEDPEPSDATAMEPIEQPTPVSIPSVHGDAHMGEDSTMAEAPVLEEIRNREPHAATNIDQAPADMMEGSNSMISHVRGAAPKQKSPERRLSVGMEVLPPSLDADSSPGQVRYYGPTTQLHIQSHSGEDENAPANIVSVADFAVNMDSRQLRDNLIKVFWGYHTRAVRVVDEHLFTAHRLSGKRSQYYSNFLECALLACATRLKTSRAVRKLGRLYADRAKEDLVRELEQPTVATLQGFLLLSDFEATSARDRIGWTYSGIACRLLFDLGLHQDCAELVRHGILVESDIVLRHELFLSAFVYDRLWALYLGRPSCIPVASLQQRQPSKCASQQPPILRHWVRLCHDISEVTEILNCHGAALDHNAAERLTELGSRISAAHDDLPPELSSRSISELHDTAYGLNIQYHGIQIVLHRALIKIRLQNTTEGLDLHNGGVEESRNIIFDNAVCIGRLVLAFHEIFGVESFITVMLDNMYIAASTLISHILQPPTSRCAAVIPDAHQILQAISETMEELQKHFAVTERMRRTLALITKNTPLVGLFGSPDVVGDTQRSAHQGLPATVLSPVDGSWGSMEALVHDDFILSQSNIFGNFMIAEPCLHDTSWLQDIGTELIQ